MLASQYPEQTIKIMRKSIITLISTVAATNLMFAEFVQMGTGQASDFRAVPVDAWDDYGWSKLLLFSDEIGPPINITTISYQLSRSVTNLEVSPESLK